MDGDDATGRMTVREGDAVVGNITWTLTGDHNRMNALAAMLAARHAGVPLDKGLDALSRFRERRNAVWKCVVLNEASRFTTTFAHHPTAIATTVGGLRRKVGNARILAVIEPRSNTMKLGCHERSATGQSGRL